MISNSAKRFYAFSVWCKTLNAACFHLNFGTVVILTSCHVCIIVKPKLMDWFVWNDVCLTSLKIDAAKGTKYRAVGNA